MIVDEVRNGREDKSAQEQNIAIQLDSKKSEKRKGKLNKNEKDDGSCQRM
jgi:hypothetical protein